VKGSILDGIIWIFVWLNASGRTMALRSAHLLTEVSTGAQGRQCCHTHLSIVKKLWETHHPGSLGSCQGMAFTCASSCNVLLNKAFQAPYQTLS